MSLDSMSTESAASSGYRGGSSEEESKPSSPNVSHHRPRERKRRRQFRNRGGKSPELSSQSPSPTREEDENIYDQSSECPLDVQEERAVNYKHFQGLFPPTIDRKWSSSSDSEYSRLTPVYPVEETGQTPRNGRKRHETLKENFPVTKKKKSVPHKSCPPSRIDNY